MELGLLLALFANKKHLSMYNLLSCFPEQPRRVTFLKLLEAYSPEPKRSSFAFRAVPI